MLDAVYHMQIIVLSRLNVKSQHFAIYSKWFTPEGLQCKKQTT